MEFLVMFYFVFLLLLKEEGHLKEGIQGQSAAFPFQLSLGLLLIGTLEPLSPQRLMVFCLIFPSVARIVFITVSL